MPGRIEVFNEQAKKRELTGDGRMRIPVPELPAWPGLAGHPVTVGGVTVTAADAARAAGILATSGSTAIAAPLRAAGNPLGECDYWAVVWAYHEQAGSSESPVMAERAAHVERAVQVERAVLGECAAPDERAVTCESPVDKERIRRRGAAGRPSAKTAFCAALAAVVDAARREFLGSALAAFRADERYAAAMASDAMTARRRAHANAAREQIRLAADRAVRECRAHDGQFSCDTPAACGTGGCRFADPRFRDLDVPAPPGRRQRPANHITSKTAGGGTFSEAAALAAWLDRHPYRAAITVADGDGCAGSEPPVPGEAAA